MDLADNSMLQASHSPKEKDMNRTLVCRLSILLIALIAFGGCQSENPVSPVGQTGLFREKSPNVPQRYIPTDVEVTELVLPETEEPRVAQPVSRQVVQSAEGGIVSCEETFTDVKGTLFVRTATLLVPPGALPQDTQIGMKFDSVHLAVVFEPHGLKFDAPVELDFTVQGFANPDSALDFYYFDDSHNYIERVPYQGLMIDRDKGEIKLIRAQLAHFSRYGFGR